MRQLSNAQRERVLALLAAVLAVSRHVIEERIDQYSQNADKDGAVRHAAE